MISIGANTLNELMNFVINTNDNVGANKGIVTLKNVVALLALSSLAASYTYVGIPCKPEIIINTY